MTARRGQRWQPARRRCSGALGAIRQSAQSGCLSAMLAWRAGTLRSGTSIIGAAPGGRRIISERPAARSARIISVCLMVQEGRARARAFGWLAVPLAEAAETGADRLREGGAGNDDQLFFAAQLGERLLVQCDDLGVVAANDEQGRGAHLRECWPGKVR